MPHCGVNLNEETCACKAPPDPRLSKLSQLLEPKEVDKMANPKTKTSRARRDMRRANLKLDAVTLNSCLNVMNRSCPIMSAVTGYYKGNPVIEKPSNLEEKGQR